MSAAVCKQHLATPLLEGRTWVRLRIKYHLALRPCTLPSLTSSAPSLSITLSSCLYSAPRRVGSATAAWLRRLQYRASMAKITSADINSHLSYCFARQANATGQGQMGATAEGRAEEKAWRVTPHARKKKTLWHQRLISYGADSRPAGNKYSTPRVVSFNICLAPRSHPRA